MRSLFASLLLLLPFATSIACGGPSGGRFQLRQLTPGVPIAVGTQTTIYLSAARTVSEEELSRGCGAPPSTELILDRVTCEPDCTASLVNTGWPDAVLVTSQVAGDKRVVVEAHVDDDSWRRAITVQYREPTRIEARRDPWTSPSGTRHGMFPGDAQRWELSVANESGPLAFDACALVIDATGPIDIAVVEDAPNDDPRRAPPCSASVTFEAREPGVASLVMSYGRATRTERVVVGDPAHVRRASVRQLVPMDMAPLDTDVSFAPGPGWVVVRAECGIDGNMLVPVLEMDDGTTVLGGIRRLRAEPESISLEIQHQVGRARARGMRDGALRGDFGVDGRGTLDVPFIVRSGCDRYDGEPLDAGAEEGGD